MKNCTHISCEYGGDCGEAELFYFSSAGFFGQPGMVPIRRRSWCPAGPWGPYAVQQITPISPALSAPKTEKLAHISRTPNRIH